MTTNNHTAIATGETNAPSTLNTRFSDLDSALGNLTTLTTTAKSNLVAAISEVDAALDSAIGAVTVDSEVVTGRGTYSVLANRLAGIDALPGAARVGANVSAAATSMTLRTAPNTVGTNKGWLIIDPYTTECEVRKIASVSGTTVNFHEALAYGHSADDPVMVVDIPRLTPELFGAVGDGATDDATALQAALDQARAIDLGIVGIASDRGAVVELGPGIYQIASTITIPLYVTLRGMGRSVSSIRIDSGFSGSTDADLSIRRASYAWAASGSGTSEYYLLRAADNGNPVISEPSSVKANSSALASGTVGSLTAGQWDYADNDSLGFSTIYVRLSDSTDPDSKAVGYVTRTLSCAVILGPISGGDSAGAVFNTRIEGVSVVCDNYVDIGVYSDSANELSGLFMSAVLDAKDYAVRFETSNAQNFSLQHLEIQMTSAIATNPKAATAAGIYISAGNATPRGMADITSVANPSTELIHANIQIEDAQGIHLARIHTEHGVSGILIGELSAVDSCVITGLQSTGCTSAVTFAAQSDNCVALAVSRSGSGETNLINDLEKSIAITANHYGLYAQELRAAQYNDRITVDTYVHILEAASGAFLTRNAIWDGAAWDYAVSSYAAAIGLTSAGDLQFRVANTGTAGNPITFHTTLTVKNNAGTGRVLIGTTTAGASILRVVGLPTSAAGLSAGDVWSNSGVLTIA